MLKNYITREKYMFLVLSCQNFYLFRRYTNLRSIVPPQKELSQSDAEKTIRKTQINIKQLNQQSLLKRQKQLPIKFPSYKPYSEEQKQARMTKQNHLIYKKIKQATKIKMLLTIFLEYRNQIKFPHILNIFDRLIFFDNAEERQDKERSIHKNRQSFDSFITTLHQSLFQEVHAPELYLKYLHIISKTENEELFQYSFPICIKVLNKQLAVSISPQQAKQEKQPRQEGKQVKAEDIGQDAKEQKQKINELISLQSNLKFLQALIRIINHRTSQISQQNWKIIHNFIRQSIKYLHIPKTPAQIDNNTLWNLVNQYISIFPKVRLGSTIMKNLLRDCMSRIKYEGLLEKAKQAKKNRSDDPTLIPQTHIVSNLRKLFTLQKIFIQQTRISSLEKEIIQTKENNLSYNIFYILQHKIDKFLSNLLPFCKFQQKSIDQDMQVKKQLLFHHGELALMMHNHLKILFSDINYSILTKCDLLKASYNQLQLISAYLTKFFLFISSQNKQSNSFLELTISNSYNLIYFILSKQIEKKIPSPIYNNIIDNTIKKLFSQFSSLSSELQVISIWCVLNTERSQNRGIIQLISMFIDSHLKSQHNSSKQFSLWYSKLLIGNQNYLKMVKNGMLQIVDGKLAEKALRSLLQNVRQLSKSQDSRGDEEKWVKIGYKFGERFQKDKSGQDIFESITKHYQSQSIKNRLFTSSQIELLKKENQLLSVDGSKVSSTSVEFKRKDLQSVKKMVSRRIACCFRRLDIMVGVMGGKKENYKQKIEIMDRIQRIFKEQFQLLSFKGMMTKQIEQKRVKAQQLFKSFKGQSYMNCQHS